MESKKKERERDVEFGPNTGTAFFPNHLGSCRLNHISTDFEIQYRKNLEQGPGVKAEEQDLLSVEKLIMVVLLTVGSRRTQSIWTSTCSEAICHKSQ